MSRAELDQVEDLVNTQILGDMAVVTEELPRAEAEAKGAIAFFGDKYGERVRVVHAGERSVELCGGTHVERLGMIGPVEVVSESSIGSNLRRVEALTGTATLERLRANEARLAHAAGLLKATPEELGAAIERRLAELREVQDQLRAARQAGAAGEAADLAAQAHDGIVVARRDGLDGDGLRELALAVLARPGPGPWCSVAAPSRARWPWWPRSKRGSCPWRSGAGVRRRPARRRGRRGAQP